MPYECSCVRHHDKEPDGCGNCRFFFCAGCTYPNSGDCRRHAPRQNADQNLSSHRWFPQVSRHDWCGDYSRRTPMKDPYR